MYCVALGEFRSAAFADYGLFGLNVRSVFSLAYDVPVKGSAALLLPHRNRSQPDPGRETSLDGGVVSAYPWSACFLGEHCGKQEKKGTPELRPGTEERAEP